MIDFISKEFFEKNTKPVKKLAHSTILVCGACGLVGTALVRLFLSANKFCNTGIHVFALARNLERMQSHYADVINDKNLTLVAKDVRDISPDFLADENVNFIFHCASPAHPVAYANIPVDVMTTNFMGTKALLDYACQKHSRLLFVSSSEVYGETNLDANAEIDYGYTDILKVRSCYPESKRAAETLCVCHRSQYGTDVVIARLCQTYGPFVSNDNSRADAQFLRKCLSGENIVLKSSGAQLRSMCYVKDVAWGLTYVMALGMSGEAYNVSNPNSIASIRELAETMALCAGVQTVFDCPDEEKKGYSTIQKAVILSDKLMALGWTPQYSLREGVEETIRMAKEFLL